MSITTVKATISGTQYNLTYNAVSQKWEASLTAPAGSSFNLEGGYYNVGVTATDDAGNSSSVDADDAALGTSLRLVVKERQAPTISIASPGAGAYVTNNTPTFVFTVLDNTVGGGGDSGVKLSTVKLKADGGSDIAYNAAGMSYEAVSGGYRFTYIVQTALSDGAHTFTVNAEDNDGNAALEASRSFTVDTVAPVLNVTSPADGLVTNQSSCTVAGATNDATSSPVSVAITLNGADQGAVTVAANGEFSKTLTLANGANTIVVTATDSAGKSTSASRSVSLNTAAPVFTAVEITPNPADAGATYIIKVTVTDA